MRLFKNNPIALLFMVVSVVFASCDRQDASDATERHIIDVELINNANDMLTKVDTPNHTTIGYHCTSETSDVVCNVFPDEPLNEVVAYLLNENEEVVTVVKFRAGDVQSDGSFEFTAYNELNEPLCTGIFNEELEYMNITDIFGNDVITKALKKSFLCNMSMGTVSVIWGIAVGTVSMGAGALVSLAFTALSSWVCDHAK